MVRPSCRRLCTILTVVSFADRRQVDLPVVPVLVQLAVCFGNDRARHLHLHMARSHLHSVGSTLLRLCVSLQCLPFPMAGI
jgi:hypothetical protein